MGSDFLKEQGYILSDNKLYQDNQSAMKIILNGKRSSGTKTKHMDNRVFWIKDRLASKGIEVEYCPTSKMIADFFTKPLQGALFRKLRDVVLGYKHIASLQNDDGHIVEERVGNERKTEKENNETTMKDPINDSKDSGNITAQENVTWVDVVKNKAKFQKDDRTAILLKQSNSKKI